jgi:GNAT superfamily N-acetyltransferase
VFVDLALARRIEAAECGLCVAMAELARADGDARAGTWPIAGGAACFAGPDSPCTKLVGLGLERGPDDAELEPLERAFDERRTAVRAEVTSLAGATAAALCTRGYALEGFEYVLGRPLADTRDDVPTVAIESCTLADHEAWIDTIVEGFAHPDAMAPHEEFPRDALARIFERMGRSGDFRRWLVRDDGRIAAVASLRIDRGLAMLCGSATLPAMRRRGLQSALVRHRLAQASRAGCDLAIVTAAPGSKSQQNLERAGFALLYVRAILVRPCEG